jgi:hypothetical protein
MRGEAVDNVDHYKSTIDPGRSETRLKVVGIARRPQGPFVRQRHQDYQRPLEVFRQIYDVFTPEERANYFAAARHRFTRMYGLYHNC